MKITWLNGIVWVFFLLLSSFHFKTLFFSWKKSFVSSAASCYHVIYIYQYHLIEYFSYVLNLLFHNCHHRMLCSSCCCYQKFEKRKFFIRFCFVICGSARARAFLLMKPKFFLQTKLFKTWDTTFAIYSMSFKRNHCILLFCHSREIKGEQNNKKTKKCSKTIIYFQSLCIFTPLKQQ